MLLFIVRIFHLEDILPQIWYSYALHLKKLDNAAYEYMNDSFFSIMMKNGIYQVFKYHNLCCLGVILILTYYFRILRKVVFFFSLSFNIRQLWKYRSGNGKRNRRRTKNTIAKGISTKEKQWLYKTVHLKIE